MNVVCSWKKKNHTVFDSLRTLFELSGTLSGSEKAKSIKEDGRIMFICTFAL